MPALLAWGVAALLLGVWALWFTLGQVVIYEVSSQARLEVRQASHALTAQAGGRVVRNSLALGASVHEGEVLVELDATRERLALAEAQAHRAGLTQQGIGKRLGAAP